VSDSEKAFEENHSRPSYAPRQAGTDLADLGHPSFSEKAVFKEALSGKALTRKPGLGKDTKPNSGLVSPSRRMLALFATYLHWYIGRHFHAMRLANGNRLPSATGPLIVYANHASWWDPLSCIVLSRHLLPRASHYGPMDAAALKHYAIFRKLGLFPVETGTPRGAAQFLRAAREILSTPNAVLWVTPEGRFTDVRTRPPVFRPGLAALVARTGACTVVPLALEYTFWDERLPEILISCGEPIRISDGQAHTAAEWSSQLAAALVATQDELAALSKLRDPALFSIVLSGRVGIGTVYDAWKRWVALLTGRIYEGSHGGIRRL
jgi:1-acyl-sn-glycerol-3-phosphate acyltransferase